MIRPVESVYGGQELIIVIVKGSLVSVSVQYHEDVGVLIAGHMMMMMVTVNNKRRMDIFNVTERMH